MLDQVPDNWDKRPGSIIYDALAPAALRLAMFINELYYAQQNSFIDTATGQALDYLVVTQGLTRIAATYAIRLGKFYDLEGAPMEVPIGSRFQTFTSSNNDRLTFVVIEPYIDSTGATITGQYRLQCEQAGTVGNTFPGVIQDEGRGNLLALTNVNGLGTAILDELLIPARDEETDEELRARFKARAQAASFGGNVPQYIELVSAIDGVGQVQIYPVWNGGGTVGVSIIDPSGNPVSAEFIQQVAEYLDPENVDGYQGTGIGAVPIGHKVTVMTPTEVPLNITASVELQDGYSLSATQARIDAALTELVNTLKLQWGEPDNFYNYNLTAYYSQVIVAIVGVEGVVDVTNVTLNNGTDNVTFTETGALQEIPVLGTVTLTEV